jgi:glycosyltransferase involved in cell wall biosynthesis
LRARLRAPVRHATLDLSGYRHNPLTLYALHQQLSAAAPTLIHAHGNKAVAMCGQLKWLLRPASLVGTIHNVKRNARMYASMDACIAVSSEAALSLRNPHQTVVLNGVDPSHHHDTSPSGAWDGLAPGPRVLAAGRLVHAKGFDVLLDAWRQIGAPLVIAGEGPLRSTLEAAIRAQDLGDRVRLLGHRADISRLMREADLFALPSRREGGPYTLVEALQCGLPAVCTRVGAVPDLVPSRYICTTGDAQDYSAAVQRALADLDGARTAYGPHFQRATTTLSCRAMVAATEAVYLTTMARRAALRHGHAST